MPFHRPAGFSYLPPIVLPLTLRLLCGSVVELDTMGLVRSLLFMVVIPAAVAMLLCRFWGKEPCTRLKRRLALPSKLMLLLIVGSNITRCADKLHHLDSALLFLMLASILPGLFCQAAVPSALRHRPCRDRQQRNAQ